MRVGAAEATWKVVRALTQGCTRHGVAQTGRKSAGRVTLSASQLLHGGLPRHAWTTRGPSRCDANGRWDVQEPTAWAKDGPATLRPLRQDHGVLDDPKSLGVQRMHLPLKQIEPSPHKNACNARSLQKIKSHRDCFAEGLSSFRLRPVRVVDRARQTLPPIRVRELVRIPVRIPIPIGLPLRLLKGSHPGPPTVTCPAAVPCTSAACSSIL